MASRADFTSSKPPPTSARQPSGPPSPPTSQAQVAPSFSPILPPQASLADFIAPTNNRGLAGVSSSSLTPRTECYSATSPSPLVRNRYPGCYKGCYKVQHKVLHSKNCR